MKYDYVIAEQLRFDHYKEIVSRLQAEMKHRDVDAMLIVRGDNFNWINAHPSIFLKSGGQGMAMLLIPQCGAPIGIINDHEYEAQTMNGMVRDWRLYRMWTGWESRYSDIQVNYQSDLQLLDPDRPPPAIDVLKSVLNEIGLRTAKIAVELRDLKHSLEAELRGALENVLFTDAQSLLQSAYKIKTAYELYNLRHSAFHQWNVTHAIMSSIKPGDSYAEIRKRLEIGAAQARDIDRNHFLMLYAGKIAGATERHYDYRVQAGDLISVDLGFVTRGYLSDSGRAYVLGEPSEIQRKITDVYTEAHIAVREAMTVGARLGDLYDKAASIIRAADVADFRRGHIGHSLGCSSGIEEYPYTSHGSDERLEAGMVMTLEIPFYARGFGSFFQEEILLITDGTPERLTTAPIGLNIIQC